MHPNRNFAQIRSLSNPVAPSLQEPGYGYFQELPNGCLQRVRTETRKAFSAAREVLDMLLARKQQFIR